jgi:hypothetical protein
LYYCGITKPDKPDKPDIWYHGLLGGSLLLQTT